MGLPIRVHEPPALTVRRRTKPGDLLLVAHSCPLYPATMWKKYSDDITMYITIPSLGCNEICTVVEVQYYSSDDGMGCALVLTTLGLGCILLDDKKLITLNCNDI